MPLIKEPLSQPRRQHSINVRLSAEEYAQVQELATQMELPLGTLARDFLLQAVALFIEQQKDTSPDA